MSSGFLQILAVRSAGGVFFRVSAVAQAFSQGMRNVKKEEERAPTRWRGSANNKGLIRRLKQRNELQAARRVALMKTRPICQEK
jgi:hypothetical protein